MRHLLIVSTLVIGGWQAAPPQDAAAVLGAARQALGGDARLSSIVTFTASGRVTMTTPPMTQSSTLEISCEFPDKHLDVRRRTVSTPFDSFDITIYEGVAGVDPIDAVVAPGAPFPVRIPSAPPPTTAAEIAAAKERQAVRFRQRFARVIVALFAGSVGAYQMQFTSAASSADGDVVEAIGPGGAALRIWFDRSSRLPVKVAWMDRPVVVAVSSGVVTVRRGSVPRPPVPSVPQGDPTVGMPDATWEMAISDHRVVDGVNWPRRLIITADGKPYEEVRIDRFRVNAKIDPKTFAPRK